MEPHGIEKINPLHSIGEAEYTAIWQKLFSTLLAGFWGRAFFAAFLMLALFFGVRRRNPRAAALCIFLAAILAYGAGVIDMLNVF
jgi:membrane-associated PAP2 superfamily phosphatase